MSKQKVEIIMFTEGKEHKFMQAADIDRDIKLFGTWTVINGSLGKKADTEKGFFDKFLADMKSVGEVGYLQIIGRETHIYKTKKWKALSDGCKWWPVNAINGRIYAETSKEEPNT